MFSNDNKVRSGYAIFRLSNPKIAPSRDLRAMSRNVEVRRRIRLEI
jgi:hypothetical protein